MAAFLAGERIDALAELLDRRAVPFKGMNLEALDGFLSALVAAPEPVPMDEWTPLVWGGKPPRWADAAEAREVQALFEEHLALATRRACHEGDELPDHLAPLLWLPEDPEAPQPDELDLGRDWAGGFLEAVGLREAAWADWFAAEPWIDGLAILMDQLASGEVMAEDPTLPPTPLDYRARVDIVLSLPAMLADLHHHRIAALTPRTPVRRAATPERNAPCPCGSGRKYKKCCGA